jgi:von Willebrand factor type A domain
MHFGSNEGIFRIFPGRSEEECGSYDPRLRPWYIAAGSGPKNVVMVLDTSGSMERGQKMDLLKLAATRVIKTLTVSDRVSIVPFSSTAGPVIGDSSGRLLSATEENKANLVEAIGGLVPIGGTNFYDAFASAFDSLDQSLEAELNVPCNSAILFFTDGEMNEPEGIQEQTVIDLVSTRLNTTMQATGKPVMLFTYSISDNDDDVHTFPKQLACSTGELGVWSKIADENKIVESLNSYYRLFALGLAQDRNMDFVAWVEPYSFATGGVMGTTASAPVYDRSRKPYLFLGVVGIDFPLAALDKALGVQANNNQGVLDRIVRASTAKCPSLNLTVCELESFRRQSSAGDDALCTPGFCSEDSFVDVEATKCPGISDYPNDLWANSIQKGESYEVSLSIISMQLIVNCCCIHSLSHALPIFWHCSFFLSEASMLCTW